MVPKGTTGYVLAIIVATGLALFVLFAILFWVSAVIAR